jgi:hypothetical protein
MVMDYQNGSNNQLFGISQIHGFHRSPVLSKGFS